MQLLSGTTLLLLAGIICAGAVKPPSRHVPRVPPHPRAGVAYPPRYPHYPLPPPSGGYSHLPTPNTFGHHLYRPHPPVRGYDRPRVYTVTSADTVGSTSAELAAAATTATPIPTEPPTTTKATSVKEATPVTSVYFPVVKTTSESAVDAEDVSSETAVKEAEHPSPEVADAVEIPTETAAPDHQPSSPRPGLPQVTPPPHYRPYSPRGSAPHQRRPLHPYRPPHTRYHPHAYSRPKNYFVSGNKRGHVAKPVTEKLVPTSTAAPVTNAPPVAKKSSAAPERAVTTASAPVAIPAEKPVSEKPVYSGRPKVTEDQHKQITTAALAPTAAPTESYSKAASLPAVTSTKDSDGILIQVFTYGNNDDEESGIPGRANIDYPTLEEVPVTSFTCDDKIPGYYADEEADCQVWHYCGLGVSKQSFVCPVGTVYSQTTRVCDWWFNVNCAASRSQYGVNADLYRPAPPPAAVYGRRRHAGPAQQQQLSPQPYSRGPHRYHALPPSGPDY